jgi:hypothetical protein
MITTKTNTGPSKKGKFHDDKVQCVQCGRELNSVQDRIDGDNNDYLCEVCYRKLLFPDVNERITELFD